jgi:hypothetical protein
MRFGEMEKQLHRLTGLSAKTTRQADAKAKNRVFKGKTRKGGTG